jgi:hypothetical protein
MLDALPGVLRGAGLDVVERPGWQRRGHGDMGDVLAIVLHHTAGPKTGEAPSLEVVEDGRPDLAGPLAHLVLGRSGKWYVVAAGLCWHTGVTLEAWQSNAHAIGIEAEATGVDAWPAAQYDSYLAGARALADHYGVPYGRVLGHREVCSPPGRKIDPNFDCAAFRAALAEEADVPLSDADVERIARRAADLVWQRPTRNTWGDIVEAQQILNGTEGRGAKVLERLSAAPASTGGLDLEALAERVVDLLATRLGGRTE